MLLISGGRTFPSKHVPPDTNSFAQISLGSRQKSVIGPYSYWNMQFYQPSNQYVMWEVSVPRGASIGFYARRNALPTHTHYDLVQILRGFKTNRSKRSSPVSHHSMSTIPYIIQLTIIFTIKILRWALYVYVHMSACWYQQREERDIFISLTPANAKLNIRDSQNCSFFSLLSRLLGPIESEVDLYANFVRNNVFRVPLCPRSGVSWKDHFQKTQPIFHLHRCRIYVRVCWDFSWI